MSTPYTRSLAQLIASAITARLNCIVTNNAEWQARHETTLNALADLLPSGSGFDNSTAIDWTTSNSSKIVLLVQYHHMNDGGMYDGWTEHTATITPSFDGISIAVSGRNRNDIKSYIADTMHEALITRYTVTYDATTETTSYTREN